MNLFWMFLLIGVISFGLGTIFGFDLGHKFARTEQEAHQFATTDNFPGGANASVAVK